MTLSLGGMHTGVSASLATSLGGPPRRDTAGVGIAAGSDRNRSETLDFARVLGTSDRGLAGASKDTPEQKARVAAEEFVSITLVQPLMKMAREANSASAPFGPSEGEQAFGGLLDATYAQEIVRAAQFPLVDRLARDMLDRASPQRAEPAGPRGPIALGQHADTGISIQTDRGHTSLGSERSP